MGHETFYEITKRSIPVVKNDGIQLTWHDSVICVRTDKGMSFFEFSYNLECLAKGLDILEQSIPSPKNSPAEELCKSPFINSEMENYEYTEMILDSSFWPHNKQLTQEMTNISMSAWSPSFFIDNKSVLAILNNVGGVEFIIQNQHKWESLTGLSKKILDSLIYKKSPQNFEQLQESVYIVETSSICWAPKLNPNGSCNFVTAQKNGVILFWQIFNDAREPVLKGKVQSDMSEIKSLLWLQRTDKIVWLICANVSGHVFMLVVQIEDNEIQLLNMHILWQYKDRVCATCLNCMIKSENVVVFYSKHRHLIVHVLDKNCKVLSTYTNNINDHRITDIRSALDGYYLGTLNVKIFKINICYTGNTVTVDLIPVELKDPYSTFELHALCFSHTNTLCALGMIDRKLLCRKEVFKVDVIIVSSDSKLEQSIISTIINNPTKKLTDYWDCIETLRYKINKAKQMPAIDCQLLFAEGSNDIYKLKIYLILLTFYLSMRRVARVCTDLTIPELSVENVKEKILLLHAQSMIEKLYKKHKANGSLDDLENESLYGCIKYLKLYSKKHKTDVVIDKKTLSIVKSDLKYICQSCNDNILEGFTCKNGHFNMYCMISFTPISDDYLACKCCNATARADMYVDESLCVFCDQRLIKPD